MRCQEVWSVSNALCSKPWEIIRFIFYVFPRSSQINTCNIGFNRSSLILNIKQFTQQMNIIFDLFIKQMLHSHNDLSIMDTLVNCSNLSLIQPPWRENTLYHTVIYTNHLLDTLYVDIDPFRKGYFFYVTCFCWFAFLFTWGEEGHNTRNVR